MLDPARVIFLGVSSTPICYYRCALPATALGADWVGVEGEPPNLRIDTGIVKGETRKPVLLGGDYDVIVLQEVFGPGWIKLIEDAQSKGIRVIYEINDYLHGIPSLRDHGFSDFYTPERLRAVETAMEACDAVTVTTKYLKKKYQRFAKRIYVCPNGIDLKRYELTRPDRGEHVNVGWAGATGHWEALAPWLEKVAHLMDTYEKVNFVTIGQPIAEEFKPRFGQRALSVPWAAIEQYPAAMTLLDIALAPAANTRFHRGKSDLRWLEAGALGIPVIGNSFTYPEIRHGVDGFLARDPAQAFEFMVAMVHSPELRRDIGEAARTHVRENRTVQAVLPKWQRALAGE
jgi:glycosyltransferase involved in cell wall biosynthesis